MSGPIVRKYGFPNFDSIFGKRELEHGQQEGKNSDNKSSDDTPESGKAGESKADPKVKKSDA
ncbi:hypothetical protein ACYOEI_22775 [Singulisphaera rosea]